MKKKPLSVAIHQPNYAPWCGYFAKIRASDVFVFLDDVQMPNGRSYVYRSQIRNREGVQWLSVPTSRGPYDPIMSVGFADGKWPQKHLKTLRHVYAKCPFFKEIAGLIEPVYGESTGKLAEFNIRLIRVLADYLGLGCRFERASGLAPEGQGDDRLISLAKRLGADVYVSGKGGQNYQDPEKFAANGIRLDVRVYRPVPYEQVHGGFMPGLSILDALFHLGRDAVNLLRYPEDDNAAALSPADRAGEREFDN